MLDFSQPTLVHLENEASNGHILGNPRCDPTFSICALVPLHRGYDGLKLWQAFWVDEEADAAADEAFALEGERHLMDGGRSDGEEAPDVGFSGRPRASE